MKGRWAVSNRNCFPPLLQHSNPNTSLPNCAACTSSLCQFFPIVHAGKPACINLFIGNRSGMEQDASLLGMGMNLSFPAQLVLSEHWAWGGHLKPQQLPPFFYHYLWARLADATIVLFQLAIGRSEELRCVSRGLEKAVAWQAGGLSILPPPQCWSMQQFRANLAMK